MTRHLPLNPIHLSVFVEPIHLSVFVNPIHLSVCKHLSTSHAWSETPTTGDTLSVWLRHTHVTLVQIRWSLQVPELTLSSPPTFSRLLFPAHRPHHQKLPRPPASPFLLLFSVCCSLIAFPVCRSLVVTGPTTRSAHLPQLHDGPAAISKRERPSPPGSPSPQPIPGQPGSTA